MPEDPVTVVSPKVVEPLSVMEVRGVAAQMIAYIEEVRKDGNSIGGVVGCVARGVPSGWGEPIFDKLGLARTAQA